MKNSLDNHQIRPPNLIDEKSKLYEQDLIKWKIIKWGSENGMNYYNLTGFNPNPQTTKEEGTLRYKKKWGGRRTDYWIIIGVKNE